MNSVETINVEEEELEAPSITRRMLSSGYSMAFSTIFHLIVLLLLAFALNGSRNSGSITLEVASDQTDLYESTQMEIEFEMDSQISEAPQTVELESDSLDQIPVEDLFDFSAADAVLPSDGDLSNDNSGSNFGRNGGASSGFFGITPTGERIVYIIDMSPSMASGYPQRRYDRAIDEVMRSVDQLSPDQKFNVILFCFKMHRMPPRDEAMFAPNAQNKKRLATWLASKRLEPGTDPRQALVAGLGLNPTCCFLLSDGEFNGRQIQLPVQFGNASAATLAAKYNQGNAPIHTIGLEDEGSQNQMKKIARDSGGSYKFIPRIEPPRN
jgi:hypothetical protein